MINTIQPKELLLVRTKSAFAENYGKLLKSKLPGLEVHCPGLNEIIDATKERHIYQLKLKDSLLNNLNFVKVGHKEIQVAWLRGKIQWRFIRWQFSHSSTEQFLIQNLLNNLYRECNENENTKGLGPARS